MAVAAYLDAQLAAIGQLDRRFSALRRCTVSLLRLGTGSASEGGPMGAAAAANGGPAGGVKQEQGTGGSSGSGSGISVRPGGLFPSVQALAQQAQSLLARLQELQAAAVGAEVRIMGGSVSPTLSERVTHVVGIALPRLQLRDAAAAARAAEGLQLQAVEAAPEAVLRGVAQQQRGGGAAVARLRLGLSTRSTHLVSDG